MNIIVKDLSEHDNERMIFIGDVRYFYIASDHDIVIYSKSSEIARIDASIIRNEMIKYIPPKRDDRMYEYFKDNNHHVDNITEKIFDILVEAYLLNTNVYLVPIVEKITKEYFENIKRD